MSDGIGYMTEEERANIKLWLIALVDYLDRMTNHQKEFVNQMIEREDRYGDQIRMSPKQYKWLGDIYDEFVNGIVSRRDRVVEDAYDRFNFRPDNRRR